ncbi:MAG: DUF5123 domain-containing protein [Paludibacteraceae bacterium]|nr:DUF5123 domain-containing protein [Paludibacteraceae bacterium]
MKKHFLLLTLTALYSLGVVGKTLTAEWGYLQSTKSYTTHFSDATSFEQNGITLNANYDKFFSAGFTHTNVEGVHLNNIAHYVDISVTEGNVLSNIYTSNSIVNNLQLIFSSEATFDDTKIVGDITTLPGNACWGNQVITNTEAPQGARSARIKPVANTANTALYYLKVTAISDTPAGPPHTASFKKGNEAVQGTVPDPITKNEEATYTLPEPANLTYTYHTFNGWKHSVNGEVYAAGTQMEMGTTDVEYTAQWKEIPAIPGVLDINEAVLVGEEWTREDGWIKRGDKKLTTGSVTWTVNATKTGEYNVSMNISSNNGLSLVVTVFDSEQQQVAQVNTSAKGESVVLGSITVPSTGIYTVVVTNTTTYSHSWFKDLTFEYVKPTPTASFATLMKDLYPEETYTQTVTTNSTGAVTYGSNNESVATVDPATGEVTAGAQGTATITATIAATEDFKETSASYTVSVLAAPVAGRKYYIEPGTDRLYDVIENAQENDTVIFRDGIYTETNSRTFKTTITLMADEGAHPVINTTSYIKPTKGLTIDGIDINSTHNSYLLFLNCSNADDIILKNATIHSAGSNNITVETPINRLIIDNCVLTTSSQYLLRITQAINLISITKSTFMNATHSAIYLQYTTNAIPTIIDHCTFYNDATSSYYVIHGSNFNSSNMTVSNCVLYNPTTGCQKGIVGLSGNNITVTNCMVNNCGKATENTTNTKLWTDDPLIYVENGDYFYQNGSPIVGKATDGSNLGDPRWHAPIVIIDETATEKTVLTENLDKTVNVQLVRSLNGGMFNTFCLPFDLSADQIAASDLAGAQIIELTSTSFEEGKLFLNFEEVEAIEAGVAYLIAPVADVENPAFEGVTITMDEAPEVVVGDVDVRPSFIVTNIAASPANLFLYQDNTLYYAGEDTEMNGMRAYFHVHNEMGLIPARMRIGRRTPTDDQQVSADTNDGKFLYRGHLYIRRNGVVYGVLGY